MAETPPPGVLSGGRLLRVRVASGEFRWYQMYEFPAGSNMWVTYQFNDVEQVKAAFGGIPFFRTWSLAEFETHSIAAADAEEIIGRDGSWTALSSQIIQEAAAAAGINDPTLLGQMINDPEMQQILAQASIGEWTPAQIKAAQRDTDFWKNTLYPGIENLYPISMNPEQDYATYVAQVTPALLALGYEPGADGTLKSTVADMLNQKIDSNVFISQVPTFIRATQNAEFATVLNAWAERDLGRTIDFNDWFDLMAGESQPDLEQVAERATLEWVAQNQGTTLSQTEIESIAAKTQMDPLDAQRAFSEFNQGILSLGDEALGRYGLSRDEVLSAAVGVAPTSGRTIDEIKLLVSKTAREQGLADDEQINFYVGFNPMGQPIRPGLQSLSPEGA